MVTIPRTPGPVPPPRKRPVNPFVGDKQEIATTVDPEVHRMVAELLDDVHSREVVGIAVVAVSKAGEVTALLHTQPQATANVNLAIDKLKSIVVSRAIR